MKPVAILIGGANGAGKTTFARQTLRLAYPNATFLNADEIQRESIAFSHPMTAGRELLKRIQRCVSANNSFAVETTLSSKMYARHAATWKRRGYRVVLHFIELPSADHAVQRVAERVAAGGHGIPEEDVRRRYARGLKLFESTFKDSVDAWYHWYSDEGGIRLVEQKP